MAVGDRLAAWRAARANGERPILDALRGQQQPQQAAPRPAQPASRQASPTQQAQRGDPQVFALQQQLAAAGFDPGPLDGIMGPRTRAAMQAAQQASASAPLPRPNPGAPLPNPRPAPPVPYGSATRDYSIPIQAAGMPQMPTGPQAGSLYGRPMITTAEGMATPPRSQQNPDLYAGWQGAAYRDTMADQPRVLGPQGHGGWPDFTAMTMPQLQTFLQRWQSVGRSWDDLPPMFNEVWNARMEQARADAVIAQNQLDNHHTAFRGIFGTDPRVAPPAPPVDTSIGEGEYLPAEYAVLGQLANNMASAPRAVTSPQLPFRGGFTRGPTLGNLVGPGV